MPSHNPECTHGYSHSYSECRNRYGTSLKMLEDSISTPEAGNVIAEFRQGSNPVLIASELTPADREALRVALAGLSDHDPSRDPDADADAAQRAADQF